MQKIVATILHAAGGSQIRILRTVAHGDSEVYNFPYLWNTNLVSEEYKQLRRVFAPNARFELHGCGVASETSILKPGVNMRDTRVDNTVSGTFSGRSDRVGLVYLRRGLVCLWHSSGGWNQCTNCVAEKLEVRGRHPYRISKRKVRN